MLFSQDKKGRQLAIVCLAAVMTQITFLCTYQCQADGGRRGIGWGFDIFHKIAVKFPTPGQKCEVKHNWNSPPWKMVCGDRQEQKFKYPLPLRRQDHSNALPPGQRNIDQIPALCPAFPPSQLDIDRRIDMGVLSSPGLPQGKLLSLRFWSLLLYNSSSETEVKRSAILFLRRTLQGA